MIFVNFSGSSSLSSFMRTSQWEYFTYEFLPTLPEVSRTFGSSNLDGYRDGE